MPGRLRRPRARSGVPLHRRLTVRVFAVVAAIALVATAAATWATVQTTSVAVQQEQQDSLHADALVYAALTRWAATHDSWSGAAPLLARLAATSGRRLLLVGADGRSVLAPTGARYDLRSARAVVDALDVDTALAAGADSGASGPASPVPQAAALDAGCGDSCDLVGVDPGRTVDAAIPALTGTRAARTTRSVRAAANRCLRAAGSRPLLALSARLHGLVDGRAAQPAAVRCLDAGVEQVLRPRVAPRAWLLDLSAPAAGVFWDFSPANRLRIALLAVGVLVVALAAAGVFAAGLSRPLRRMTAAAHRAAAGDLGARMPVRRADEVGEVAAAFNAMADRREQLERSRQRLMSDVSHDLRSPLANVRGWIEAAQDGVVARDDRLLATLHAEAMQLQHLIDDLHDLALGDAGGRPLDPVDVAAGPLLDDVARSFRPAADRKGVALIVDGEPAAVLRVDPARFRQVLVNLLSNALRHTDAGGSVSLTALPHGVRVTDTGEGIPADETEAVFERFHRVDPSRTRATGGSGLGLAIVRQVMTEHGGTATLTSRIGRGTAVEVSLPAVPVRPSERGSQG